MTISAQQVKQLRDKTGAGMMECKKALIDVDGDGQVGFNPQLELVEPGLYQAEATFPLKGVWDILVSVKNGEDEFNTHHRISAGVKYSGKL